MNNNPLEGLVQFYKDQVKEADERGYADVYKKCTEAFFQSINDDEYHVGFREEPLHFSDVEYLDGYYIFATGTNSVVHFYIDECPGWKFGIWWNISTVDDLCVIGTFFAQFEETIDKFKPNASIIRDDFKIHLDSEHKSYSTGGLFDIVKAIKFIKNEPMLAFCRDYLYWDYNFEYHTREEATEEFSKYKDQKNTEDFYTMYLDDKFFKFLEEKIVPLFNNARVVDNGEFCSPKYQVVAPFKDNIEYVDEPGCYSWFEPDDKDGLKTMEEFDALKAEAEKCAEEHNFHYFDPVSMSIIFYSEENDD